MEISINEDWVVKNPWNVFSEKFLFLILGKKQKINILLCPPNAPGCSSKNYSHWYLLGLSSIKFYLKLQLLNHATNSSTKNCDLHIPSSNVFGTILHALGHTSAPLTFLTPASTGHTTHHMFSMSLYLRVMVELSSMWVQSSSTIKSKKQILEQNSK